MFLGFAFALQRSMQQVSLCTYACFSGGLQEIKLLGHRVAFLFHFWF